MNYRGVKDRQVSLVVAALLIVVVGATMAFLIMQAIGSVDFTALAAESAF